jgi:formate hydrogenlyase subunit 4
MQTVSLILLFAVAAVFHGLLTRTRSLFSGRKGPKIFQHLFNVAALFRKGEVISVQTSGIFSLAPTINLTTVLLAATMLPFGKFGALIAFSGDFVMFAFLLALGRFAMLLGALDTASSFEGMGASREALYGMLVEPAFFVLAGVFSLITGNSSLDTMFTLVAKPDALNTLIPGLLAACAFFLMLLVETGRLPVDDPKTHLELTMIHEVMILDHSGFNLALIHLATYIKAAMYATFIALCTVPANLDFAVYMSTFIAIVLLTPIITGYFESFRARNRMQRNSSYILTIAVMAIVAFVTAAIIK